MEKSDARREKPRLSERGKDEAAQRRERLAAALRQNLKRRKAQARARSSKPEGIGEA